MSRWTRNAIGLGYEVFWCREPDRDDPGSSHCKLRRMIWLDPDAYGFGESLEGRIISLAHELGHIHDQLTEADVALDPGTVEHAIRKLEREETAWLFARRKLSLEHCWPDLEAAFEIREEASLSAYRAKLRTVQARGVM